MVKYILRRLDVEDHESPSSKLLLLSPGTTDIGRHSQNKYCLVSPTNPCLISRRHAQIECCFEELNGKLYPVFTISDSSLNGTYINNCRIRGKQQLVVGSVVTFGHVGGHNIAPGQMAPRQQAEFQFVFEKMVVNDCVSASQRSCDLDDYRSVSSPFSEDCQQVIDQSISAAKNFTQSDSEFSFNCGEVEPSNESTICCCTTPAHDDGGCKPTKLTAGYQLEMKTATWQPSDRRHSLVINESSLNTVGSGVGVTSKRRENKSKLIDVRSPLYDVNSVAKRSSKKSRSSLPVDDVKSSRKSTGTKRKASVGENIRRRKQQRSSAPNDMTFHNDDDLCASLDCCRPQSNKVSWVQCDDCDAWYHTECVGCTSDLRQLEAAQFHCGCT